MILATSAIIKVLLVLAVLLLGYRIFRKKLQKKTLFSLGVLILLFAAFANWVASLVPPLTDTVTLTALGEGREEAKNTEIFLKGYTIDGEESLALEDLQISSGHWFWIGDMYCWRPKSDERQPDGVTESVELQIPVGWNRTLNFQSSIYRGEVQIETAENTWVIDTYSEENGKIAEQIGRSSTAALIWNQILHLEVYTLLLAVCFGAAWIISKRVLYSPQKAKNWISRNNGKLMYAGIALFTFVFMFQYADDTSLWFDELGQISFSDGTIWEAIQHCLTMKDLTPPLFSIIATIWYHIVPYGEQWLLLLPIIFTVLTIYLIGVIGERLKGKYAGTLSAVLMAFSSTVWIYVGYEYRAYSFFLFFSTLTFYFYIRRNENGICKTFKKYNWGYTLSMLGLTMSHYFGMLACAIYVLFDIFLFSKRKIYWKRALDYILPCVVSAVWILSIYITTLRYRSPESMASWYSIPNISHIQTILKYLSGNFDFTYWLFLLGIGISISVFTKSFRWVDFYNAFSLSLIFFVISIIWIYGNFINTESTMWQDRYFILLVPHVILLTSNILHNGVSKVSGNCFSIAKKSICVFLGILCFFNCFSVVINTKSRDAYREAADWIYSQGNHIFNEETVVLSTSSFTDAWNEYYIQQQCRRDNLNVKKQSEFDETSAEIYDRIYIEYNHTEMSSNLQEILKKYYTQEQNNSDVKVSVYVRKSDKS